MRVQYVVLPVLVVSVLALGAIAQEPGATVKAAQAQAPAVPEVELKATKYEFTPSNVDVALNSTVRLKITAVDRDHGFEIDGVKDSNRKIKKGESATVEYKATKAGTIKFKCNDFCGLGHGKMNGTITVK